MSATASATTSLFSPSYFDRYFLRLLGLKVFSINHKDLDKIIQTDQTQCVIKDGLQYKKSFGTTEQNSLRNTINNHFGGLSKLRKTPVWKLHIDVAMAIFNNRLLVLKEDGVKKNVMSSSDALHVLMAELFALDHEVPQVNMARMGMIYRAEQSRKNRRCSTEDYKIACSLLPRIPALTTEEVKQLYAYILEWMVKECNKECDKLGRLNVETIIAMFNDKYNYNTVDLGPANEVLDNLKISSEALDELYEVWQTVDTDFPVLHKNVVKYTRQSSGSDQNKPARKRIRRICSRLEQQIKTEIKEEDLSETPVNQQVASRAWTLRSRAQTRSNSKSEDNVSSPASTPPARSLPSIGSKRQSRSMTKIRTNLPRVVINPLPPALLRSNDITICNKDYPERTPGSLKRKNDATVEEDQTENRTKRVCRSTRSNGCAKLSDQSLSKSPPVHRLSPSSDIDHSKPTLGLTYYGGEEDVNFSGKDKELIKLINPTNLDSARENAFNERSKKVEEKEQILEKRHHLLLKIKIELEDREKRQDEREKTQNERIKSQNEREKMLNEREKGLDSRDKAQNEREKLQNERERVLDGKTQVMNEQFLNFQRQGLQIQKNSKHSYEKSDKNGEVNEEREARNGTVEESSDEDDQQVNLKAGDMALLLESMIKNHLKKTKPVKKGKAKPDQRKIH